MILCHNYESYLAPTIMMLKIAIIGRALFLKDLLLSRYLHISL